MLTVRKIDIGGGLGAHVVDADDRRDDRLDLFGDILLQVHHVFQLRRVEGVATQGLIGLGQQVAVLIDDGDVLGRQFRHAARDQVHDCADLLRVKAAPGVEVEHHRCSRLLLLAHEHGWFRQGQVDARRLHRTDRLDRPCEFAFERTLEIYLFEKLGHAELLVLHQLEAHVAAFRQALGSQLETGVIYLAGRNHDGAATFGELVRNVHLLQRSDNRAAITVRKI